MKNPVFRFTTLLTALVACALVVYGQGSSTSSISGAVADPTDAVISGAQVIVKNNATSAEFKTVRRNPRPSLPH